MIIVFITNSSISRIINNIYYPKCNCIFKSHFANIIRIIRQLSFLTLLLKRQPYSLFRNKYSGAIVGKRFSPIGNAPGTVRQKHVPLSTQGLIIHTGYYETVTKSGRFNNLGHWKNMYRKRGRYPCRVVCHGRCCNRQLCKSHYYPFGRPEKPSGSSVQRAKLLRKR